MAVIDIKVPPMGESITEVTLSKWLKKDGDVVKMDEPICEFESDKATLDLPAEVAGQLKIIAPDGSDLSIGAVIAKIDTEIKINQVEESKTDSSKETIADVTKAAPIASPSAAKIIREQKADPGTITGTGKDGRITKEDAQNAVVKPEPATTTKTEPVSLAKVSSFPMGGFVRTERREKMTDVYKRQSYYSCRKVRSG